MITRIVSFSLLFALGVCAATAAYDPGRFEREVLVPGSRDAFFGEGKLILGAAIS